ncbi:MAG: hypothetical protein KAW47_05685 [Thermoplasmatales archaeon]|nr:hypothetical protein [Thermoplasmatales archaeon]
MSENPKHFQECRSDMLDQIDVLEERIAYLEDIVDFHLPDEDKPDENKKSITIGDLLEKNKREKKDTK